LGGGPTQICVEIETTQKKRERKGGAGSKGGREQTGGRENAICSGVAWCRKERSSQLRGKGGVGGNPKMVLIREGGLLPSRSEKAQKRSTINDLRENKGEKCLGVLQKGTKESNF